MKDQIATTVGSILGIIVTYLFKVFYNEYCGLNVFLSILLAVLSLVIIAVAIMYICIFLKKRK